MVVPRFFIRMIIRVISLMIPFKAPLRIKSYFGYLGWCINSRKFSFVGEGSYLRSPSSVYNPQYMKIGNSVSAEPGLIIEAFSTYAGESFNPKITIGDRVSFGYNCHVGCINEVTIGDDVLIASRVFITDHSHGRTEDFYLAVPPAKRSLFSKGAVRIGSNVWIGEGVSIMPGVTIGNNSVIGANSVVTHNVPDNCVFAGVPARFIKNFYQ